ncbi:hypothetical protein [Marinobacterium litorale]|uniref:hypothetical protein n=1 Tax=Marinobacterium litorale TaxID=404770 RepID=UPI00041FA521|nr:hypothetical protein [Marinobacterium litorale]
MTAYTNLTGIPLSVALWLTTDDYDYDQRSNHISATTLLKPVRQIVLSARVPPQDAIPDIASLVPSRMGSAIHGQIEQSWLKRYKEGLIALGYPQKVVDKVRVNPTPEEAVGDIIPVYLERRAERHIDGYVVSGKFDFVADGRLEDFKSTGVFTYMSNSNDAKYIKQGSIYRWLNPDIITQDRMAIQFIFTDWSRQRASIERAKGYPQNRTLEHVLPLDSPAATEAWIRTKLSQITQYQTAPDELIPRCTDEDLWRKSPVWKYYKNKDKMSRSTKNFDTQGEANIRLAEDGYTGVVVEVKGKVTACKYCSAFPVCKQKDEYLKSGELEIEEL